MAASRSSRIQKHLQSAEELVMKGERQKALTELHKVLDIDPGNSAVKKKIMELEREISAMKNFRKTRESRTHAAGRVVTAEEFVSECISRADAALKQGDEVRALQELERAKHHDPDNREVRKKIHTVRRHITTENLYDLALAKLKEGDPASAVKNARAIFEAWPAAPLLDDLLRAIESHGSEGGGEEEIEEIIDLEPEAEDIEFIDEAEELESEPEEVREKKPEKPGKQKGKPQEPQKTPPDEVAVASIRNRIARSELPAALAEARKAVKDYPDNPTLKELAAKLEKMVGGEESKAAAARAKPSAAKTKAAKTKKPKTKAAAVRDQKAKKKKKSPVGLIAAVLLVVALVVVFVVVKPFGAPEEQETVVVQETVFEPFQVTYTVSGPDGYTVALDGEPLQLMPDGSFVVTGDSGEPRTIELRAAGFETKIVQTAFESGQTDTLEISLDTLGTHTVQIVMQAVGGGEGPVGWLVDGTEAESNTVDLPTGIHVFQAVEEGFNSVPESILVDYDPEPQQIELALLSQEQSQVVLALAGDVPGAAVFTIDGARVASGVRRISEVLPLGSHTLRVELEDYEPWERTVNLGTGGYSATVSPTKIETTGRLLIAPEPWADVTIDGTGVGRTPMLPVELPEGQHTVLLTNPDYEDQTVTVDVVAGEDVRIQYTAAEKPQAPEEIAEEQPVSSPFAISQVAPVAPDLAAQMGDVHGYVTLDVVVGTDGSVKDVSVVSDELGLGCGAAAADAVRQWVFSPAMQGGEPVEVTTRVQVRFDIE